MSKNILFDVIGFNRTRWVFLIVLGILAVCLWFSGLYSSFFGKFLTWGFKGISNIPSKILAIIIGLLAWSGWRLK